MMPDPAAGVEVELEVPSRPAAVCAPAISGPGAAAAACFAGADARISDAFAAPFVVRSAISAVSGF